MSELKFAKKAGVLNAALTFVKSLNEVSLKPNDSLLLIGKSKDLKSVQSSHLASVLKDLEVPETWFSESIRYLCPKKEKNLDESKTEESQSKSGSNVSWLNKLIINKISGKCSRNNTPSKAHLVTKAVRSNCFSENQLILVACEKQNSVALACAIARAFPLYTAKSGESSSNVRNVSISFLYTDQLKSDKNAFPSQDETLAFNTLAKSVRLTAEIIDKPCAVMNTDDFLNEIKKVGQELSIEPFVIEGEELNKQGFGGLYNVGKAAKNTPKLVVLSHLKPNAKRTVAWVGKGIVYDTGGLCIKSRTNMCGMKVDCGGAAGVLGAFYSAVKLGFEDNLHAVFCLAENAVGPDAYRPDDIIRLYSGKTVEITNTDAEGRLVLGDGVAYSSKDLKADIIVDMATLTGAQGPATGKYHAAVLTNNEKWERACVDVGKSCGDLCYPLVFAPELHFSEFNSEMADMKNSVSKGDNAASACAGLFVHSHLAKNYDGVWIHLDIASPVQDGDRATGYGVALLNSLFADSSSNQALRSIAPSSELPIKNGKDDSNDD